MTLETAKRIVSEQGNNASKEALAVVRGGMTICENQENGIRKYKWIKIMPTKTDDESSIEMAMKIHQKIKQPRPIKNDWTKPVLETANHQVQKTKDSPQEQEPDTKSANTLSRTIAYLKRKFNEFVKMMDVLVEE
jgi:hypothetical protein